MRNRARTAAADDLVLDEVIITEMYDEDGDEVDHPDDAARFVGFIASGPNRGTVVAWNAADSACEFGSLTLH